MHLSEIFIENFRVFGSEEDGSHLHLRLHSGLNVIAGENDSGKTAIMDAIRLMLWTTSYEYVRLTEEDFHVAGGVRAEMMRISGTFSSLSSREQARFLEWLSADDSGKPCLVVTMQATRLEPQSGRGRAARRVGVTFRAGGKGEGPPIEGEIREFLRITYLRPLRDAEAEMAAGRGSRLSQILENHPDFAGQADSDFDPSRPVAQPKTLVGIMRQAEHLIAENAVVTSTKKDLNEGYLDQLSITGDPLRGDIGVARSTELRQILEKLELWLQPPESAGLRIPRGLGFNNVLFMGTELLLLGEATAMSVPLLLIEEPEAHLHPQMQLQLMSFLEEKCGGDNPIQVLLTTHSPNLASNADLESVVLTHKGRAFPLESRYTRLDASDYRFLRRFLDVTKANLLFAKGVVIVEGDAENILLPVFAELLGTSFSKHGVSIVNVGSRGLFRYARIFERKDGTALPTRVACVADRDVPPDEAKHYLKKRTDRSGNELPTFEGDYDETELAEIEGKIRVSDGATVKTFVSPTWTFEHDLACGGLAEYVHVAVQLARALKNKPAGLGGMKIRRVVQEARKEFAEWRDSGLTPKAVAVRVYEDLYRGRASKAETAQVLAEILRRRKPNREFLEAQIPAYITEAIGYVTS